MKKDRLLISGTIFLLIACVGFAFIFGGCAASNLTGAAKVHQTVTLVLADECTAAIQAKAAYEAGTLPQTDAVRYTINDAGAACEQAKIAFTTALTAELAYRNAEALQVNACIPQAGAVPPPANPQCEAAGRNTAAAKVASDNANAALSTKLASLPAKAAAVKAISPQK